MQLTLLVPELIWPEPDDPHALAALTCPALSTILARSTRQQTPAQSLEATLSDLFEHPEGAPYGALRLLGEAAGQPEPGDSTWICSDPVHLRFHQERLILAESSSFSLQPEEAQAFVDTLNAQLADVGRFHVGSAGRWYLQLANPSWASAFDAPPLSSVAGRSVDLTLLETNQARALRNLLNEIQTVLHSHPINPQRAKAGHMSINSLWLWGAGELPERRESFFDGVWSTNPLALGLARAAGVPTHPLPLGAAPFLAHAAPETEHLVVLEALLGSVQYENAEAYRQAMSALENQWFAPLRAALATGRLKTLRLVAPTAYATLTWESRRSAQWKFWRRPQTLAALAKKLAKGSA